jgi:diguanylate cyclase (GGDEF)-like protein
MTPVDKTDGLRNLLRGILGLQLKDQIALEERQRHIHTTAWIALVTGLVFALFNILTERMLALGLVELAAVVLCLLPAVWLSNQPRYVGAAEALMLVATVVILGSLLVLGGVAGTGVLWVFTAPFVAFFLAGQRRGWWYSGAFVAGVAMYLGWLAPQIAFAHLYGPVFSTHLVLALCFYTLVAAAFNLLRTRFEEQLQQRVEEKTADAKALLGQLQYLATHDALTDLPNKVLLLDMLQTEMARADAEGHGLVVCNLHLERFFELGNVLGNEGSDRLVRHIAQHLASLAEGRGTLARTGRDEFVIAYRLSQATVEPETLQQFIAERQFAIEEQGYTLYIEFTLGLALYPAHSSSPQQLLDKAEQAMLQARKSGQQWNVYSAEQEQVFVRHHLLFGKLREALLKHHLQVHFQPQVSLATGRVLGAEALARWNDPASGAIPPSVFIPVAEESGLIRLLTTWLVGECLRECARWHALGLKLDISINLSALNLLDPELMEVLQSGLADTGLQARHINLEITESCFMASPERAMEVIQRIHDCGFKLSIDDFGTGYSSLSYMKSLPIDELKIDQSFVRRLLQSPGDQAIVASTIELAHNLHLSVVAEGIEDQTTADWLRARGCDIGQGYCFARALPPDEFIALAQRLGTAPETNA